MASGTLIPYSVHKSWGFGMKYTFRLAAGILCCLALILQFWLVQAGTVGPGPIGRTVNFFSYFTILTNILAGLAFLLPDLMPNSPGGQFFSHASVRTGIAAYIIVVMAVVYFILRHLSNLQGLDFLADLILHYIMPTLLVIDWLFFVPKETLKLRDVFKWLWFPVIYLAWTFIHGAVSGFYPYPFLNTAELGIWRVLLNEFVLVAVFFLLGIALVTVGKFERRATS
jgi:hypothetical protein